VVLCLSILTALYWPTPRASAQGNDDPTAALNRKADKFLKKVYQATLETGGAVTRRTRTVAGKQVVQELVPTGELGEVARKVGVRVDDSGRPAVGLTVLLSNGSTRELKDAGFKVGAQIGDIATVETDPLRLPELASFSSVMRMTASIYRKPLNDRARKSVGIDNAAGQRVVGQTGRGVVVGIIDTGIDVHHADFQVPGSNPKRTRIKAMWDMSDGRNDFTLPGTNNTLGKVYDEAAINAALANPSDPNMREKDVVGHGTHVLGTAAGNGQAGGNGVYAGMAPEADLVIVKAIRNDTAGFRLDDEINALEFIRQQAAALNEPFVINMSLGGQAGPHDGTGPDERAIDTLVSGAPGRAVCIAAGNEGADNIHASGRLTAGSDITLNVDVSGSPRVSPDTLDFYFSQLDRFTVTVTRPDGQVIGPVAFNPAGFVAVKDQYVDVFNALDDKGDTDPDNDQNDIFLDFKSGAENLGQASNAKWTVKIHADSVSDGAFNVWLGGGQFVNSGSNPGDNLWSVEPTRTVSSPGTARGAITVGAFVTRSVSQTINNYAFFTSVGPTADGRRKPDVSTPGYYLYSARSADVTDSNFGTIGSGTDAPTDPVHYTGLAGTSMATPVVTGSVALMLQAKPALVGDWIKNMLIVNANHDNFDPAGWNSRFGWGKVNVAAALQGLNSPTNPLEDARIFIHQHYGDFLDREPDQGGWDYWTNEITKCGGDAVCVHRRRIGVSASFFFSPEFQDSGFYIYRFYKATLGRQPTYDEFSKDHAQVIGGTSLQDQKVAFADAWVQRPAFTSAYASTMSSTNFVNKLFDTAQLSPFTAERQQQISAMNGGKTRSQVIRDVIEIQTFKDREFYPAFVRMEYFGYLRRDPDPQGEAFWVDVLTNKEPGNFSGMVCSFITSAEYQLRFGGAVNRSNRDCQTIPYQ
jgi:subtilisin family serine protease